MGLLKSAGRQGSKPGLYRVNLEANVPQHREVANTIKVRLYEKEKLQFPVSGSVSGNVTVSFRRSLVSQLMGLPRQMSAVILVTPKCVT